MPEIFSGRPDASWTHVFQLAAATATRGLRDSGEHGLPPEPGLGWAGLGYRGLHVAIKTGARGEIVAVRQGWVALQGRILVDRYRKPERCLLDTAPVLQWSVQLRAGLDQRIVTTIRKLLSMPTGPDLIETLKQHVIDTMLHNADCSKDGGGLGNIEIEELSGLALRLPSQDHYLTYSLLQALIKDGRVEQLRHPNAPRRPKYRLR